MEQWRIKAFLETKEEGSLNMRFVILKGSAETEGRMERRERQ